MYWKQLPSNNRFIFLAFVASGFVWSQTSELNSDYFIIKFSLQLGCVMLLLMDLEFSKLGQLLKLFLMLFMLQFGRTVGGLVKISHHAIVQNDSFILADGKILLGAELALATVLLFTFWKKERSQKRTSGNGIISEETAPATHSAS